MVEGLCRSIICMMKFFTHQNFGTLEAYHLIYIISQRGGTLRTKELGNFSDHNYHFNSTVCGFIHDTGVTF